MTLAVYSNSVLAGRGFQLAPHHYVMCTGLEDLRIPKLLITGPPGTGKSTILSMTYPTYRLGKDPTTTVLGVSAGEKLIQTFMHAGMEIIQHSKEWQQFFPEVRPDIKAGWSTGNGVFVTGRNIGDQDASWFAAGLKSKAITGVHAREIILDDPHDEENSKSPEGRDEVQRIYYQTIIGRGDPRGVRMVCAGRRWARDDLYGHLRQSGEWVVLDLPAERKPNTGVLWYDIYVPRDLECVFTETLVPEPIQDPKAAYVHYKAYYGVDPTKQGFYWPKSPSKRSEYMAVKRGRPAVAETTYNGRPEHADNQVFKEEDFRHYIPPEELNLGLQSPHVQSFVERSRGKIAAAMDTAYGQQTSASKTVHLAGLLVPCSNWHNDEDPSIVGPCDFHYDVLLLDMFSESVKFADLVKTLRARHAKWRASPEIVEDKASGISLIQVLRGIMPIKAQKVPEGKIERAINGVGGGSGSAQGWAQQGRIAVPAGEPWVEEFIKTVVAFRGDTTGRSDEFDTLVHLVNHAILLSSRSARTASGLNDGSGLSDALPAGMSRSVRASDTLNAIGGLASSVTPSAMLAGNPFVNRCGAPCYAYGFNPQGAGGRWCKKHGRPTAAIQGCMDWKLLGTESKELEAFDV